MVDFGYLGHHGDWSGIGSSRWPAPDFSIDSLPTSSSPHPLDGPRLRSPVRSRPSASTTRPRKAPAVPQSRPAAVVQAIVVEPARRTPKRKQKRRMKLIVPPSCDVWAEFATPLDRTVLVPVPVAEWLLRAHRQFRPELLHHVLRSSGTGFESAFQYMYHTWFNAAQMAALNDDIYDYVHGVRDDAVLDPDRYATLRPGQVVRLNHPSPFPVFLHASPSADSDPGLEAATLSVYWSSTTRKPSQLQIAMNEAAYRLWGYTRQQWESHHVHNVEDPSVRHKVVPFFFALFSPSTVYTIIALDLGMFLLRGPRATFRCHIMRRDGKMVLMQCTFTVHVHTELVHVSRFAFAEVGPSDLDQPSSVPALAVGDDDDRELIDAPSDLSLLNLDLPVFDDEFLNIASV